MLLAILFVVFFSGIAFIVGIQIGIRAADKNYKDVFTEQGLVQTADIINIRANRCLSATERKHVEADGTMKQIEWGLARDLLDTLIRSDLIKKTTERLTTEESFRNNTGPDTLYRYEIHVIDPDVFS